MSIRNPNIEEQNLMIEIHCDELRIKRCANAIDLPLCYKMKNALPLHFYYCNRIFPKKLSIPYRG